MPKVLVTDTNLTNIADAIREKNKSTSTYKPSEMASAIKNIEASENLTDELNNYENALTTQETTIDNITELLQSKGTNNSEQFDKLIQGTITELYSNVTSFAHYCCYYRTSLETVNLPNVTWVGSCAFQNCIKLASVSMPKVKNIMRDAFYQCSKIEEINFPYITAITDNCFHMCTGLKTVDLGSDCSEIGSQCFSYSKLETLILRRTTDVCMLNHSTNKNSFVSTPIEDGTGYIYVPDELVDSYKAATNWSNYASQIKPISELEG